MPGLIFFATTGDCRFRGSSGLCARDTVRLCVSTKAARPLVLIHDERVRPGRFRSAQCTTAAEPMSLTSYVTSSSAAFREPSDTIRAG